MRGHNIRAAYFDWLIDIVGMSDYRDVMGWLHSVDYIYRLPMDGNRYEDGVALRYRFGDESEFTPPEVAMKLDIRPCSMLEMLVALDLKIFETTLDDGASQPGLIFRAAIENLGLHRNSSARAVTEIIAALRKGTLSLFPVKCGPDTEIWIQAQLYLNEVM